MSAGTSMFARYAYPPNALGYCGPDGAAVLLDDRTDESGARIAEHARQFEGAWAYLQIIADAAQLDDPLDARVVEAYWVGNQLLDGLDPDELAGRLRARLPAQPGATWMPGRAHHGYQVFAVYPWVRLLAQGVGTGPAVKVLDQCRIRWGEVVAVEGERATIRSRPLIERDGSLALGPARAETAAWSIDGQALLTNEADGTGRPRIAEGAQVALHWDWVCDVLTPEQVAELETRSAEQLELTNQAIRAIKADHR